MAQNNLKLGLTQYDAKQLEMGAMQLEIEAHAQWRKTT